MCAAKVSLDDGDDVHDRMLMTIFKALTGNARDPPRRGGHWDLIGFQGADPATDLRGVGILSLLNGLYLVTRRRAEAQRLYALSRGDRDFPFMTVSINVTKICLEALRCGALTPAANARGSVVEAFHCLHAALYSHMGDQWQARQLTIRVRAPAFKRRAGAPRAPAHTALERYSTPPLAPTKLPGPLSRRTLAICSRSWRHRAPSTPVPCSRRTRRSKRVRPGPALLRLKGRSPVPEA